MLPQSLIKVLHQSATAGLLLVLLLAGSGAARAQRIKDIASINGVRSNQLES